MKNTTIAVDIAKDVFEIAVSHEPGVVDEKRRVTRKKFLSFFVNRNYSPHPVVTSLAK